MADFQDAVQGIIGTQDSSKAVNTMSRPGLIELPSKTQGEFGERAMTVKRLYGDEASNLELP